MRLNAAILLSFTLSAVSVAACATSNTYIEETPDAAPQGDDSGGGGSGGGGNAGSGGSGGSAMQNQCVSMCKTDQDCQNSCPPSSAGVNCCDVATGVCFVSATPMCPPPSDGGGGAGGMQMY